MVIATVVGLLNYGRLKRRDQSNLDKLQDHRLNQLEGDTKVLRAEYEALKMRIEQSEKTFEKDIEKIDKKLDTLLALITESIKNK